MERFQYQTSLQDSFWLRWPNKTITFKTKGSPTPKKNVYIWALPKLQFDPPYCANPGTLWHNYFAENEKIL